MVFKELYEVNDLYDLSEGDIISKKNRNNLFTGRKVNNTPQKGINWVGNYPDIELIILTSKLDSGYKDQWVDQYRYKFHYYLMINHRHTPKATLEKNRKENLILLEYQKHNAPILVLINKGKKDENLTVAGWFKVEKLIHSDTLNHKFLDSVELIRS
jgi:putative restriction endonuclease